MAEKWSNYKAHQKLVNPANKRRLDIIVVGTGLAGGSAAATLGEMKPYMKDRPGFARELFPKYKGYYPYYYFFGNLKATRKTPKNEGSSTAGVN